MKNSFSHKIIQIMNGSKNTNQLKSITTKAVDGILVPSIKQGLKFFVKADIEAMLKAYKKNRHNKSKSTHRKLQQVLGQFD